MPLISEEVLLRVRAAWQGEEVQRGLSRLQTQLAGMGRTVQQAFNLLLPTSTLGVVAGLTMATRQAVQLSAQFEKMRTGIAAILGSYADVVDAQGRVLKGAERFNELLRISQGLMTEIRKEADRTILETRELMEYVQTGLGFGLARGLTPQQIVPLISRIAVAGRVMGLPQGYPIISEIRALLTGENLGMSQIAQAVGIRQQDYARLRGEEFIRYMEERLAGFVAASDTFAQSFEARWSTFISKIQEILIEVGDAILPVLSEFAQRATVAIEQWRKSGGVQQLQNIMRSVIQFVVNAGSWMLSLVNWLNQNKEIASLLGFAGAGAAIGGRIGGLKGAGIGGLLGAAGWFGRELWGAIEYQYAEDQFMRDWRERITAIGGKATGISAFDPRRHRVAPAPSLPPAPSLRVRPIPATVDTAAERRRQAQERRARIEMADLAVAQAEQALRQAMREAAEWGYAPEMVAKAKQALERWANARLERAKASVHGEDARLATAIMGQTQIEIAERRRQVLEQLEEGRRRSLDESRREAVRALEARWAVQARIEEIREERVRDQTRRFVEAVGYAARTTVERVSRFAEAMQVISRLEQQRRVQAERLLGRLSVEGAPWQVFGMPAVAAGVIRPAIRMMPMGEMLVAASDTMAQALEDWRERQQRFWSSMRDFIVDSLHDAFVTAGMRLADSLKSWREAFSNLFRTLKDMLIRAILEVVYDRVIRAAVEAFADWLTQRLGGGGRGNTGAAIGSTLGAAIGSAAGPVGAAIGGIIGGLIGGSFQHGGTAIPRRMYMVGERGPELFVPGTVGAVLSSKALENALNRLGERRSAASVNVYVNHTTEADLARRIGREVVRSLRGAW
jgi:hypothetical protein